MHGGSRLERRGGHLAAKEWGKCERRIVMGGVLYPDGRRTEDGWPSHSPSAQWKDGDGGSHRRASQIFPEVFTRDALTVRRAIERMTVPMRDVVWLVYVTGNGVAKRVRDDAGMGRDRFYDLLGRALDVVEAQLEQEAAREDGNADLS